LIFVERLATGTAILNLSIMGRFILTPENFVLDKQQAGSGGEIH
jgi:UTP-glucose-1-phosphate uridylyltransferase